MPIPEPLTAIAITSGIISNIATDILRHRASRLDDTVVGKLLESAGLTEPGFEDRIRQIVVEALECFFRANPDFQLSGVRAFFHDPEIAGMIGGYILDRKPIDQVTVQAALERHLGTEPITVTLIKRDGLILSSIVPNYLICYRRTLIKYLSMPQIALLLEIEDQGSTITAEVRASEVRLKAFIADQIKMFADQGGFSRLATADRFNDSSNLGFDSALLDSNLDQFIDEVSAVYERSPRDAVQMLATVGAEKLARQIEGEYDLSVISFALNLLLHTSPSLAREVLTQITVSNLVVADKRNRNAKYVSETIHLIDQIDRRSARRFMQALGASGLAELIKQEPGLHDIAALIQEVTSVDLGLAGTLVHTVSLEWFRARIDKEPNPAKDAVFLFALNNIDRTAARTMLIDLGQESFLNRLAESPTLNELAIALDWIGQVDHAIARSLANSIVFEQVIDIARLQDSLSTDSLVRETQAAAEIAKRISPSLAQNMIRAARTVAHEDNLSDISQGQHQQSMDQGSPMPNISSELFRDIRQAILACGPVDSHSSLGSLFARPQLRIWRHKVPEAPNAEARVDLLMSFLIDRYRVSPPENALVLFLREAGDLHEDADECHARLLDLADKLEKSVKSAALHSTSSSRPTLANQEPDGLNLSSVRQSDQDSPRSNNDTIKDFFISYNSADQEWAEWIAWQLEDAGHSTVLQAWDFRPGSNFVLEMQRALQQASQTIAVLSPDYLQAAYPQPEWAAAFAKDPVGVKRTLVPVRVRSVDLSGLLGPIIYIDLVDVDAEVARERLLSGIQLDRLKPVTAPLFPVVKAHSGEAI